MFVGIDDIFCATDTTIQHLNTDKLTFWTLFLYLEQGIASDKVTLIELDGPAEATFEGIGLLVQFMAVEAETGLQAQGIACSQASRQQTLRFTCCQEIIPELDDIDRCAVKFKAIFTCIASTRDETVYAIYAASLKVVIANTRQINVCKCLENGLRGRTLQGKERG